MQNLKFMHLHIVYCVCSTGYRICRFYIGHLYIAKLNNPNNADAGTF